MGGLEGFRFHDLRHTAASWWRMAGVSMDDIQVKRDQYDRRQTERYFHLGPDTLQRVVSKTRPFRPPRQEGPSGTTSRDKAGVP